VREPINAEVKSILVSGEQTPRDRDVKSYSPPSPAHFGFHAQIFIGAHDSAVSDSFDALVCSPSWFAEKASQRLEEMGYRLSTWPEAVTCGTGIWFMRRWDLAAFTDMLNSVCEGFGPASTWGTLASRIGRLIPWEFDYKYDKFVDQHPGPPWPP
jgi:hypothetical protein